VSATRSIRPSALKMGLNNIVRGEHREGKGKKKTKEKPNVKGARSKKFRTGRVPQKEKGSGFALGGEKKRKKKNKNRSKNKPDADFKWRKGVMRSR